jgi:uncharacterized membrane protein
MEPEKKADNHPPVKKDSKQLSNLLIRAQYTGPLPPPEALKKYEEILPGAAERIMCMAEKQAQHRQKLEEMIVRANNRDSLLGLIFGFIIGLATIGGGLFCILKGYQWSGAFLGLSGLTGVVSAFIYGSRQKRLEAEKKIVK